MGTTRGEESTGADHTEWDRTSANWPAASQHTSEGVEQRGIQNIRTKLPETKNTKHSHSNSTTHGSRLVIQCECGETVARSLLRTHIFSQLTIRRERSSLRSSPARSFRSPLVHPAPRNFSRHTPTAHAFRPAAILDCGSTQSTRDTLSTPLDTDRGSNPSVGISARSPRGCQHT
jgi:hypothetical protein